MDVVTNSAYPTPYANSPILPMLLLSLAKQKNAPKSDTKGFLTEYDYIIGKVPFKFRTCKVRINLVLEHIRNILLYTALSLSVYLLSNFKR